MNTAAKFWSLWGLARSLLIYYGKPGRSRRDRRFYAQFIDRGELVFDIGAHVGNRVGVFLKLGAACVAVEPQPRFSVLLQKLYGRNPAFTLVQAALGSAEGSIELHISRRTPTVSTT
ncbi:MAG: FkbM family methyltransferase, partial [Caldilineaceae bacterium]|nr:FkbM family methyltransferase [Caldilineaceae bacterium]